MPDIQWWEYTVDLFFAVDMVLTFLTGSFACPIAAFAERRTGKPQM